MEARDSFKKPQVKQRIQYWKDKKVTDQVLEGEHVYTETLTGIFSWKPSIKPPQFTGSSSMEKLNILEVIHLCKCTLGTKRFPLKWCKADTTLAVKHLFFQAKL